MKIISQIKEWFKSHFNRSKPAIYLNVDITSETVPQAFGYPEEDYKKIVNDLTGYLDLGPRLSMLDFYLKSEVFKKYKLDTSNPNHAAVLGYAFCAAVVMQKNLDTEFAVKEVLKSFYDEQLSTPKKVIN